MKIVLDFDGTCVAHEYPHIGHDIGAVPWLKKFVELGGQLMLWTMRDSQPLQDAINWFTVNGIKLHSVGIPDSQKEWTDSPKIYANCYIDDAAVCVPLIKRDFARPYVNWEIVGPLVVEKLEAHYEHLPTRV